VARRGGLTKVIDERLRILVQAWIEAASLQQDCRRSDPDAPDLEPAIIADVDDAGEYDVTRPGRP
jgi:hypothetical protein